METPKTKDNILHGQCAFDTDSPLELVRWASKHNIDTDVYHPIGFQFKVYDGGYNEDDINHKFITLFFGCEKRGGDPSVIHKIGPFRVSMLEVFQELSSIDIIAWKSFNGLTSGRRIEFLKDK